MGNYSEDSWRKVWILAYRSSRGGKSLRDSGAVAAIAFEGPAMVRAPQMSILANASLGQGRQAVGALVRVHLPLATRCVPPHCQRAPDNGHSVGGIRVQIVRDGHRVPLPVPVEAAPALNLILSCARLLRHGVRRIASSPSGRLGNCVHLHPAALASQCMRTLLRVDAASM